MSPKSPQAFIVAARRSALGRIGGLHRGRRLEDLTAPVLAAALKDARIAPGQVDEIILGNASAGGNPARVVALAAGLPDAVSAVSIDRQCASGLDAILCAIRIIDAGEADAIVAGGAESLSTAPWRIAKPRSLYQLPHFIGLEPSGPEEIDAARPFEAVEALASRLGISRAAQDAFALKSHLKAGAARESRRFVGEIVPFRANAEEMRDQSATEPDLDALAGQPAFLPPAGTMTPGNTSAMHDGAAIAVVVSERLWLELGKPPALRLLASAAQGVSAEATAEAPIAAMTKLYGRLNGFDHDAVGVVEISESSAAQALALAQCLDLDADLINPDGGAVVRGHPFGASGAVLVARLFTSLVRGHPEPRRRYGIAAQGAIGGLGLAALFAAV